MTLRYGLRTAIDLFKKLQRDAALIDAELTSDRMFNFVVTARHMPEWIEKDPAFQRVDLEDLRRSPLFLACRDIGDASKHFELTPGRQERTNVQDVLAQRGYGIGNFGKGGYGFGEEEIAIVLSDGEQLDGREFSRRVLSLYAPLFAPEPLNSDGPRWEALTDESGHVTGLWIPNGGIVIDSGNIESLLYGIQTDEPLEAQLKAAREGRFVVRAKEQDGRRGHAILFTLPDSSIHSEAGQTGARPDSAQEFASPVELRESAPDSAHVAPQAGQRARSRSRDPGPAHWIAVSVAALVSLVVVFIGLGGAIYVAGWLMLVGGITEALNILKSSDPVSMTAVAIPLLKIVGAPPVGSLMALGSIAMAIDLWSWFD